MRGRSQMRNFNNIRAIDLKEYLPDVLKDVQEMRAIMEAETPEVQAIWDACENCMNDQFISEATENGVARREKMLGITPFATDTLDDRSSGCSAGTTKIFPTQGKASPLCLSLSVEREAIF